MGWTVDAGKYWRIGNPGTLGHHIVDLVGLRITRWVTVGRPPVSRRTERLVTPLPHAARYNEHLLGKLTPVTGIAPSPGTHLPGSILHLHRPHLCRIVRGRSACYHVGFVIMQVLRISTAPPQSRRKSASPQVPRTRTGCWTCRDRSVKCDGTKRQHGESSSRECTLISYDRV